MVVVLGKEVPVMQYLPANELRSKICQNLFVSGELTLDLMQECNNHIVANCLLIIGMIM
jgi:hypothetical protein